MRRRGRASLIAVAAVLAVPAVAAADHRETFLVSRPAADGTSPAGVSYGGATADGSRVYFSTADALAPEDEDTGLDLYVRNGSQTELVSVADPGFGGNSGSGQFGSATDDGGRVFFFSRENLTADDTDFTSGDDLWLRAGDQTKLVSRSSGGFGFGFSLFFFCGSTADGGKAFFRTTKALTANDFETSFDLFVYDTDTDTLEQASVTSTGQNRNGDVTCGGFTADGSTSYFSTTDRLTPDDTDSFQDVYARSNGATTLVTTGTPGAHAQLMKVSDDGAHVVFESTERLAPEDQDDQKDVYDRTGGANVLVSQGPGEFNGDVRSDFQRAGSDGEHIFFTTSDHVVDADTDDADDIFVRSGGETEIVSHGPAGGDAGADIVVEAVNRAGTRLYFRTGENLTDDDSDFSLDSYVWRDGAPLTRASVAALNDDHVGYDAGLAGATEDGGRVFFTSLQQLHEDDLDTPASQAPDGADDIFEHAAGGPSAFVSTGPTDPHGKVDAFFKGFSADGRRVWWETTQRLTAEDQDDANDVYESRVNESPTVVASPGARAYRDGDPPVVVDPGLTVTDPDTPTLTGATVRVTGGYQPGDELGPPTVGSFTATLEVAGDVLTLSGDGTPADYQAALRSVTYATDGNGTVAGIRTLQFTVTDGVDTSDPAAAGVDVALRPPGARGPAAVSGIAREGATLTGSEPAWDGSRPLTLARDWERCDAAGAGCVPIAGADAVSYVPGPADVGARLRFIARARNGAGPASVASAPTAVVKEAPAAPRLIEAPAALSSSRASRFVFDGESGAAFECALDGAAFAGCGSPHGFANVGDGPHAMRIRQLADGVASPATEHRWTVDATPPGAPDVLGPGPALEGRPQSVAFTGEEGATFECSLDGAPFAACTSPAAVPALDAGRHGFAVRQTDMAGNRGPAAEAAWDLALAPGPPAPDPPAPTLSASTHFSSPLKPDDAGLPVECRVTDGSLRICRVVATLDGPGVRKAASAVVGRGRVELSRPGRRQALVHVRLTRGGIARIRRAGGSPRIALRVVVYAFDGRRGEAAVTPRVQLPGRYVLAAPFGMNVVRVHTLQRRHLRAIASQLVGARSVSCEGHTDATASRRRARRLGLRRALATCRYLAQLGVDARLSAASRGSSRPRATNATAAGRAANRRTEVVVLR